MILRCILGHLVRELVGVLTLSMLVASGVAVAQDVAVSLGELLHAGSLQSGEGVYVTDAAGRRLKGTLSDVSSAGLVVTHGGQAWPVAVADVRRFERQDPLANGLGYETATAAGSISAVCFAGGSRPGECTYVLLYAFPVVALGGAVGAVGKVPRRGRSSVCGRPGRQRGAACGDQRHAQTGRCAVRGRRVDTASRRRPACRGTTGR